MSKQEHAVPLGIRDLGAEPKLMEEITDSVCQVIHKHGHLRNESSSKVHSQSPPLVELLVERIVTQK